MLKDFRKPENLFFSFRFTAWGHCSAAGRLDLLNTHSKLQQLKVTRIQKSIHTKTCMLLATLILQDCRPAFQRKKSCTLLKQNATLYKVINDVYNFSPHCIIWFNHFEFFICTSFLLSFMRVPLLLSMEAIRQTSDYAITCCKALYWCVWTARQSSVCPRHISLHQCVYRYHTNAFSSNVLVLASNSLIDLC